MDIHNTMIDKVIFSHFAKDPVIEYLTKQREDNPDFKVIDIGAPADYTNWSYNLIDYAVDLNDFSHERIKSFKINLNFETQWEEIFEYVEKNGKFDFCICSHTLEDLALPSVTLKNMPKIAKEGYISVPSRFVELKRVMNQPWLGYLHHRWIFTFINGIFTGFPKLNFIESFPIFEKSASDDEGLYDLSFFWKDDIKFHIINNDYLGPSTEDVMGYYSFLFNDDFKELNIKN